MAENVDSFNVPVELDLNLNAITLASNLQAWFVNFYLYQVLAFLYKMQFNPFPHNDTFRRPWETSLLKTLGKGEIARNEQFLLFPQCFLPIWITFCYFRQIRNCRLQTLSVWKSLIQFGRV